MIIRYSYNKDYLAFLQRYVWSAADELVVEAVELAVIKSYKKHFEKHSLFTVVRFLFDIDLDLWK